MEQNKSSLQIIMGPMFSGKTTELINIYNEMSNLYGKNKCLALNHALDTRYGKNKIISHNSVSIPCYIILKLEDFFEDDNNINIINEAQFIFINEAQFFNDLTYYILNLKNTLNKNIILCGLDLDFQRKIFGDLLDLSKYANKVTYLKGLCNTPNCRYLSKYTHRINDNKKQISIGSQEYISVCEECYNILNN